MFIKPTQLNTGDTVGVIAPASPPEKKSLQNALTYLEMEWGLNLKLGSHLGDEYGYLAGTDQARAEDLQSMFEDESIKAIICACGGYGTSRMAELLDYDRIRKNPKIFWGYSDITFLHTALRQKAGLVTFHGPMLSSDLGKEDVHPLSKRQLAQLFEPSELTYSEKFGHLSVLQTGVAEGEIVGGNLCLLATTLGTLFEVDTKGKLLLIEDVHEEPRNVDRYLSQLWLAGKLTDASGLLIGDFRDAEPKRTQTLELDEVFDHYVQRAGKPAMKGFQIGHCNPHIAIPLGTMARLDTTAKKVWIESGVKP